MGFTKLGSYEIPAPIGAGGKPFDALAF